MEAHMKVYGITVKRLKVKVSISTQMEILGLDQIITLMKRFLSWVRTTKTCNIWNTITELRINIIQLGHQNNKNKLSVLKLY
jgi:hypothetical protein